MKKMSRTLAGMKIFSFVVFTAFVTMIALCINPGTDVTQDDKLIFDFVLGLCMLFVYIYWFYKLNRQISALQLSTRALDSENKKTIWQAFWFIISMITFCAGRFLVLIGMLHSLFEVLFVKNLALLLIDLGPIGYMVYCHIRMFKRAHI
mmetsp:Transcript_8413/g.10298  ORF Transcript_8413/g.10298 Transcript_8413/m.10298 type:complete len:149 (+) Transcript_8413:435-881(+)